MENTNYDANNTFQELSVQPPIDFAGGGAGETDRAKLSATPGAQLATKEGQQARLQTCDQTTNERTTIEDQVKQQQMALRTSANTGSPHQEVVTNYTSKQHI